VEDGPAISVSNAPMLACTAAPTQETRSASTTPAWADQPDREDEPEPFRPRKWVSELREWMAWLRAEHAVA
jgi:hypothetical protein